MADDRDSPPAKPKRAVQLSLDTMRRLRRLAREALAKAEPDRTAAEEFMKLARDVAESAAPFLSDMDLRQRILGDEPMSEEEWERFRRGPNWPPYTVIR